mmetsp:Transcript_841/g.1786  ORF Transcript_841/g.1786 Transcript_841/m.1786 type:complete len:91 (-) Transcript_841:256-528(-)
MSIDGDSEDSRERDFAAPAMPIEPIIGGMPGGRPIPGIIGDSIGGIPGRGGMPNIGGGSPPGDEASPFANDVNLAEGFLKPDKSQRSATA